MFLCPFSAKSWIHTKAMRTAPSIIITISLILNRGDKVKDVILDSIKLKNNENMMSDKIEEALSINEIQENKTEE